MTFPTNKKEHLFGGHQSQPAPSCRAAVDRRCYRGTELGVRPVSSLSPRCPLWNRAFLNSQSFLAAVSLFSCCHVGIQRWALNGRLLSCMKQGRITVLHSLTLTNQHDQLRASRAARACVRVQRAR